MGLRDARRTARGVLTLLIIRSVSESEDEITAALPGKVVRDIRIRRIRILYIPGPGYIHATPMDRTYGPSVQATASNHRTSHPEQSALFSYSRSKCPPLFNSRLTLQVLIELRAPLSYPMSLSQSL